MAEESHPVFGLLRRIQDEEARMEAAALMNYLSIKTVEELAQNYSRESLAENDVTEQTIGALERVLQDEYGLSFAERAQPVEKLRSELGVVRGYDVIDAGDHLIVNGVEIAIPKSGLSKEEIFSLYTMHSEGADAPEISTELRRVQQTVTKYLRRAHVIPKRGRTGKRMSGAPPPSPYGNLPHVPLQKLVR